MKVQVLHCTAYIRERSGSSEFNGLFDTAKLDTEWNEVGQ